MKEDTTYVEFWLRNTRLVLERHPLDPLRPWTRRGGSGWRKELDRVYFEPQTNPEGKLLQLAVREVMVSALRNEIVRAWWMTPPLGRWNDFCAHNLLEAHRVASMVTRVEPVLDLEVRRSLHQIALRLGKTYSALNEQRSVPSALAA